MATERPVEPGDRVLFPSRAGGARHWVYGRAVARRGNNDVRIAVKVDPGQDNLNPEYVVYRNRSRLERV